MSKAGTWYFTKEELAGSPSSRDGVSKAHEQHYRETTCSHIRDVGMKLKIPQLTIATAIVFFHRFFARQSFRKYDRIIVATACLFLAGKVEEAPKKLRDVISASYATLNKSKDVPPLREDSKEFKDLREKILVMERVVLNSVAFDMYIEHPYKYIMKYRSKIKTEGASAESSRQLAQVAWNFINDSLRTTLALQHDARTMAIAALYLAFKFLKMRAPPGAPWWAEIEPKISQAVLEEISNTILDLYEDKPKDKRSARAVPAGAKPNENGTPRSKLPGDREGDKPGPVRSHDAPRDRPAPY